MQKSHTDAPEQLKRSWLASATHEATIAEQPSDWSSFSKSDLAAQVERTLPGSLARSFPHCLGISGALIIEPGCQRKQGLTLVA